MERLESDLSSFVPWSGMGASSVSKAGTEKALFGKGRYPHYVLKHRSEKPASPLIPLQEASACGGATWGREEWERSFRTLNILNTYV